MPLPLPVPAADRKAAGKALRAAVPLASHAEFSPASDRDPLGLLAGQAKTRVRDLVPVRHGRMLVSPFTFFRGAALVMADDLSRTATSGLRVQLCGDAHLSNFGAYASRERRLVFDLNDFDETLPGPFEWDVKRLAASFVIAGEDNGFDAADNREAALTAARTYRTTIRSYAQRSIIDVWYAHLDVDRALEQFSESIGRGRGRRSELKSLQASLAKARTKTSMQAIGKLTTSVDGHRKIVADPPLVVPLDDLRTLDVEIDPAVVREELTALVAAYRATLPPSRRLLLDNFALRDVAHKVVGVGSVGTRAWILLLEGSSESEAIVLQSKQAEASVLAAYAGASEFAHEGERVVAGQRIIQATSDIFLGWVRHERDGTGPRDYYVRQLRDWKMSVDVENLSPPSLMIYARLCGATLARAHARSGDRIAIAGYLGKSPAFEEAVADFAEAYARLTVTDHALLQAAVDDGRLQATTGV